MQKLEEFKKKRKNKKIVIVVGIFVVMISMLIKKTYAIYQKETEISFINAKVRFPKSSEVTYTTTSNTNIKNVEQALNDLYGKLGK